MITIQSGIAPATGGLTAPRSFAEADDRDGAAAELPGFATLMAGMLPDPGPVAAPGPHDTGAGSGEGNGAAVPAGTQAASALPAGQDATATAGPGAQAGAAIVREAALARASELPRESEAWIRALPAPGQMPGVAPGASASARETRLRDAPQQADAVATSLAWHPASARPGVEAAPDSLTATEVASARLEPAATPQLTAPPGLQSLRELHRYDDSAPAVPAAARLEAPIGSARWREDLATQVHVMLRDATAQAEIRVNPPELGPVLARVSVDNGIATVSLSAAAPETRAALESALTTLRDRLAESGLSLGEASISGERGSRFGERATLPEDQAGKAGGEANAASRLQEDSAASGTAGRRLRVEGLVDVYA